VDPNWGFLSHELPGERRQGSRPSRHGLKPRRPTPGEVRGSLKLDEDQEDLLEKKLTTRSSGKRRSPHQADPRYDLIDERLAADYPKRRVAYTGALSSGGLRVLCISV